MPIDLTFGRQWGAHGVSTSDRSYLAGSSGTIGTIQVMYFGGRIGDSVKDIDMLQPAH
jgi:hypothetical protein